MPIVDIAPAANNEAANYRIAAFLQSMRRASGHSVHLKFSIEQHLVAAQPTGTKMLNSYFSAPIVLLILVPQIHTYWQAGCLPESCLKNGDLPKSPLA